MQFRSLCHGRAHRIWSFSNSFHRYDSTTYRSISAVGKYRKNVSIEEEAGPIMDHLVDLQKTLALSQTDSTTRISSVDFNKWQDVIRRPNLEVCLKAMNISEFSVSGLQDVSTRPPTFVEVSQSGILPPTWVIIYLLSTKIKSPQQSSLALSFTLQILPYLEPVVSSCLLILVARAFAKHQTSAKLTILINTFLELPLTEQELRFNLLLKGLSGLKPTAESAKLLVKVLDVMHARQLKLDDHTYHTFLKNRFITLELTKALNEKMIREGFKPSLEHLEAFLRIFGKHGAVQDAARYLRAIRALTMEKNLGAIPHGSKIKTYRHANIQKLYNHTKWNNQFLRSLVYDRSSAFKYLRDLVAVENSKPNVDTVIPPSTSASLPRHSQSRGKGVDIYGWTTALYIASRDKSYSDDSLLHLFESGKKLYSPTVATYTAVMRGFSKRKNYGLSAQLWDELVDTKRRLDSKALTVGVEVLIGADRPLEAIELVEDAIKSKRSENVDIILFNALMSSFLRAKRPDIVFRIWDDLEPVFRLNPDANTLTILIRAAYAANKADRSFRGIWANSGLYIPLRSDEMKQSSQSEVPNASKEGFGAIKDILATKKVKLVNLWNGTPASWRAIDIFRRVVLGNWPEFQDIQPPTRVVSSDIANQGPVWNLLETVISNRASRKNSLFVYSSKKDKQAFPSLFPQISPHDKAFQAYFEILGSHGFFDEVLIALTWMRALGVVPTKRTLCLAIALCAEITVKSPLMERIQGQSEYNRLLQWLEDWIGKEAMPKENQIGHMLLELSRERNQD